MDYLPLVVKLLITFLLSATTLAFLVAFLLILLTKPYPIVVRHKEEEQFSNPKSGELTAFPSLEEPYEVNLSVVVPAYNEEERLPPMLDETIQYLEGRVKEHSKFKYEILVVSDGSTDQTVGVVESYSRKYGTDKVRCLNLVENRGKGGAVRLGVQSSRGATILFADADGATKFEDITKLETALATLLGADPVTSPEKVASEKAIVIGSRAHLEEESLAQRSVFRNILMYGFHFLVWLFTVKKIRDTQCGFKLFTRQAARICFQSLHVERWAFDVELLLIAQKLSIPIAEVPVRWTEIEGSKVTPVLSWIQMGCDLGMIWLKYTTGAWKIKGQKTQ